MTRPTIRAEFVLDEDGKPRGISSGVYSIRLRVERAPEDAYKVTYQLDPSYYDSLREAHDPTTQFAEEITSYGDYVVQAKVRTRDHAVSTTRRLYDALRESHGDSADPSIQRALHDIQEH